MTYESTGEVRRPEVGEYFMWPTINPEKRVACALYKLQSPKIIMRPVQEVEVHE